jgi:hypothetical protein
MKTVVTLIFIALFKGILFSQELHPKTIEFSSEVFRDCMEYTQPQYLAEYSDQISRVSLIILPEYKRVGLVFLSEFSLKNKCNSDLIRDNNQIVPENFNPLKYHFNFYSEIDQYIQIENSSYVILISHK